MTSFEDTWSSDALIFHILCVDSGEAFNPRGDKQEKKKKDCKEYSFQTSEWARGIHARIKGKEEFS